MKTMPVPPDTPENIEKARAQLGRFRDFAARYREDASLRARLDAGDAADSLAEIGIDLPDDVRARIVPDTAETVHFVMPPDPNAVLGEETLSVSAGGKTTSSAGTATTFGSSCAPSSIATVATLGSMDTSVDGQG